ncbi:MULTISPECIES: DUF6308 family protein [unclassified Ruegeria]|uniref:DUF6308 family protein n=1 Tax=unclassified Ruegeria TaxID=2625375 RepID=UPI001488E20E|nr:MULTISPECIES: DUF6308 family protein [unclassified Ruegeria]
MRQPKWHAEDATAFLGSLTDATAVEKLKSIQYYSSHRALVKLAQKIDDDPVSDGVRGFACAAYGWMPTILDKCHPDRFNSPKPVETIKALDEPQSAKSFLQAINDPAPINGSWVGTSKFLHFLNPELFPIWDSKVAKNFRCKWHYQINRKNSYLEYFDFVHAEIDKDYIWIDAVARRIRDEHGYSPSRVRCVELMLFERQR